MFNVVNVMFVVVPIFIVVVFILVVAQIISPKFRGKMMSRQVKAAKYMMEESKEDIRSISTDMAYATKDGIETTTRAIKKGLTENEGIYCKHCGSLIDADSLYCKDCGKKQ
ncbi:MAG: hypothetical protein HFG40_02460 [Bacilli bacterium]|nr:hypothetical protein [Bacilli bacterium]